MAVGRVKRRIVLIDGICSRHWLFGIKKVLHRPWAKTEPILAPLLDLDFFLKDGSSQPGASL